MIVAMRRVRVMQVARDEVVGVIGMRYRWVPASSAVRVSGVVAAAGVRSGALRRILF